MTAGRIANASSSSDSASSEPLLSLFSSSPASKLFRATFTSSGFAPRARAGDAFDSANIGKSPFSSPPPSSTLRRLLPQTKQRHVLTSWSEVSAARRDLPPVTSKISDVSSASAWKAARVCAADLVCANSETRARCSQSGAPGTSKRHGRPNAVTPRSRRIKSALVQSETRARAARSEASPGASFAISGASPSAAKSSVHARRFMASTTRAASCRIAARLALRRALRSCLVASAAANARSAGANFSRTRTRFRKRGRPSFAATHGGSAGGLIASGAPRTSARRLTRAESVSEEGHAHGSNANASRMGTAR